MTRVEKVMWTMVTILLSIVIFGTAFADSVVEDTARESTSESNFAGERLNHSLYQGAGGEGAGAAGDAAGDAGAAAGSGDSGGNGDSGGEGCSR